MPDPAKRVLIVAEDDRRAGPLAAGLEPLGWPAVVVRGPQGALAALAAHPVEAVIIDLEALPPALLSLPPRLKAASAPRRLPMLALVAPEPVLEHLEFDMALGPDLHPAQAVLRLESLMRAAVAEEEAELRAETFAARGISGGAAIPSAEPPAEGPLQVLTVGEPAPKFLALRHALGEAGAEITAAFTAYTAFDYLHERPFDAVVLWAGETHAEALSIAGGMKRNTRLFHVPTVLYLRTGAEVAPGDAFTKGFADVAAADTPEAETAERVLWLARAHRRALAIRRELDAMRGSGLMDAATGLFTRELFAQHLQRLARASAARRRPLSVAVLRIALKPSAQHVRRSGALDRAAPQIGAMIGRLVRVEDTAARLSPEVFALALPAAGLAAAHAAAARIAAVIACTAFESADGEPPFTVEFDLGAAEIAPGEPPALALERAAARVVRAVG